MLLGALGVAGVAATQAAIVPLGVTVVLDTVAAKASSLVDTTAANGA
jgi:hypothetical protein